MWSLILPLKEFSLMLLTFKSWEPKIVTEPNEILLNQIVWSHSHVVLSLNDWMKSLHGEWKNIWCILIENLFSFTLTVKWTIFDSLAGRCLTVEHCSCFAFTFIDWVCPKRCTNQVQSIQRDQQYSVPRCTQHDCHKLYCCMKLTYEFLSQESDWRPGSDRKRAYWVSSYSQRRRDFWRQAGILIGSWFHRRRPAGEEGCDWDVLPHSDSSARRR